MSENLFNLLRKSPQFISGINPDLKCKLCYKVMVYPCFTPCGCEFCYKCIHDYLQHVNDKCPENGEDCSIETLKIDDIKESRVTAVKVNKLLVKCTNAFCDYEDQVAKVVRHLETCDKEGVNCVFMEFGCITIGLDEESLKIHMRENQQKHLNILVNLNKELQARLSQMEVVKIHLNNENRELKEKINELEKKDEKLKNEMEDIRKEVKNQYEELKYRLDNLNGENEERKSEYEERRTRHDNVEEMEGKCERLEIENRKLKGEIAKMEVEMKNLKPFNWILEEFEEKKKCCDICWSPVFYSGIGSYKIQTGIRFYSTYYVSFCCRILKSENDSKLIWPCRKSISIKWINQNTGAKYENVVIQFDVYTGCRPIKDENPQQNSLDCYFFKPPYLNNQVHLLCEVV